MTEFKVGSKLQKSLVKQVVDDLEFLLPDDEKILGIYYANKLRPMLEAIVITKSRILGVTRPDLSGYRNYVLEVAGDSISSSAAGHSLKIKLKSGGSQKYGFINKEDAAEIVGLLDTITGAPESLLGVINRSHKKLADFRAKRKNDLAAKEEKRKQELRAEEERLKKERLREKDRQKAEDARRKAEEKRREAEIKAENARLREEERQAEKERKAEEVRRKEELRIEQLERERQERLAERVRIAELHEQQRKETPRPAPVPRARSGGCPRCGSDRLQAVQEVVGTSFRGSGGTLSFTKRVCLDCGKKFR